METAITIRRRPWLAALLSMLAGGPLGQVYSGSLLRAVVLWLIGALLLPLLAYGSILLPLGRASYWVLWVPMLAFPIYVICDAFVLARRNRDAPLKAYQRWWVYPLIVALMWITNAAFRDAIRTFVVEAFVIPTRSMSPTILPGDRILVDKLGCRLDRLRRNDVVVFRSADVDSPLYVMRVVGLPGDEIAIRNEQVLLNGSKWDDPHAFFDSELPLYPELSDLDAIKIPATAFFVLGDNRRLARDSRILGPIPSSDLRGKARIIYWSLERTFPDPQDTTHYELGPVHWERMGTRLD